MKLLPHNIDPYKQVLEMMEKENIFLYESAMGTGKSYVIAAALKKKGYSALVLVPNNTLSHTWDKVASEFGLFLKVMTYNMFSKKELTEIQSISAKYDVLVCDECHHVGAEVWGENLVRYRDYIKDMEDTYMIGITATRIRYLDNMNDVSRTFFLGNRVLGITLGDAIAGGILPEFTYVSALFSIADDIKAVREKLTDDALDIPTVQKLIAKLQLDAENVGSIDRILKTHLDEGEHKTLVFMEKIDYIPETMELLREVFGDENIFTVHSDQHAAENKDAIKNFEECTGTATMFAVNMFNEGLHLDGVDNIIMLRKTTSVNLFVQQLGRIMTPDNLGKKLFVFDFVGNHKNLKAEMSERNKIYDIVTGLSLDVTEKSNGLYQLIIKDYAREAEQLIEDLGMFLPRKREWTPEEDDILFEYYPVEKGKVHLRLPNRTEKACQARAGLLGIKKSGVLWTQEEHDLLALYFPIEGAKVALRFPNRTEEACIARGRAIQRGLTFKEGGRKAWAQEELDILREYYPQEGSKVAARLEGRTPIQCISAAQALKLRSPRNWTEEEMKILMENYPLMGEKCFEMIPKKSTKSCRARVKKMKL